MSPLAHGVNWDGPARWASIRGPIDNTTALNFEHALGKIISCNARAPVGIFLDAIGGDAYAGFKIYGLISTSSAPIFTVVCGMALSGTVSILQAGNKRFATANSTIAFHRATKTYKNRAMNAAALYAEMETLSIIDGTQMSVFAQRGRPIKKIFELFKNEARLTAHEALHWKLVDGVIENGTIESMYQEVLRRVKASNRRTAT